jgi:glycosyltransferase involved in cell wall biosynthesis
MTLQRRIGLVSAFPPSQLSLNEYGLHFARHLAERPDVDEVVVLADILPHAMAELDLGPKIRVRRVWRFNGLASAPAILRAARAERLDGLIFNLQTATFGDREVPAALGLLTPMMGRLTGVPSGIIAHNIIAGVDLEQTILKGQPIRQFIVRKAGAVVTGAMMMASYATTTLRSYADILQAAYPRADVSLVPHGTFDTRVRPWVSHKDRPRRIVTMGKFGTYKRLETLLAAFGNLRADPRHADLQLVIGGTDHPNAAGYMQALADSRAIDRGVVFAGYVAEDDIPAFFEGALISVFDYEATTGSSGVLHQTASYGAAPIFPHIGDFIDLCRDEGLGGYHYAPGCVVGMAAAMTRALDNPDEAEDLARSNRKAAQGMPMSQVIAFHMDKLGRILAGRTGRSHGTNHGLAAKAKRGAITPKG